MAALIQGLRYCAIVSANRKPIAQEARSFFDQGISEEEPQVQILAPKGWWHSWLELTGRTRTAAGNWEPEFAKLVREVEERLGVSVACAALDDVTPGDIKYGPRGRRPRIDRELALHPVRPGETPPIGPAVQEHGAQAEDRRE